MEEGTPRNPLLDEALIAQAQAEAAFYGESARFRQAQANAAQLEWEQVRTSEYENRIYAFDGPVSGGSVQHCIVNLGQWQRRDPEKPIEIIFNSPGGGVFDGLALYDYIKEIQEGGTPVNTTGLGMAASMGGILLQAGDTRTMSYNSYLLIHEVQDIAAGNASELRDQVKFTDRIQNRLLNILAERSTLNQKQIERRWQRKDWWLDAEEALKLGFVDKVK